MVVEACMVETGGGGSLHGENQYRRGMHAQWQDMHGVERRWWTLAETVAVACGAVGGNDSLWWCVVQKKAWGTGEEQHGEEEKNGKTCMKKTFQNSAILIFFTMHPNAICTPIFAAYTSLGH